MDKKQIEMLACPQCHGKLDYDKHNESLNCESCQLAFPVQDGVPVMLVEQARPLAESADKV